MDQAHFTASEIEKLAVLINCFTVMGSQMLVQKGEAHKQARSNLQNIKRENKDFLERIHFLALKSGAVSALRLSEDLERSATDTIQIIGLVHRCLLASVFLSHCIAASEKKVAFQTASEHPIERRLH
jgi:hypothetical protein